MVCNKLALRVQTYQVTYMPPSTIALSKSPSEPLMNIVLHEPLTFMQLTYSRLPHRPSSSLEQTLAQHSCPAVIAPQSQLTHLTNFPHPPAAICSLSVQCIASRLDRSGTQGVGASYTTVSQHQSWCSAAHDEDEDSDEVGDDEEYIQQGILEEEVDSREPRKRLHLRSWRKTSRRPAELLCLLYAPLSTGHTTL